MPIDPSNTKYYKRARFTTRLPIDRLYNRSHFWMLEVESGLFRIGLTRFATRMLGDLVEFEFQVQIGDTVAVGDVLGSIEGFKAISDLYACLGGTFEGINDELTKKPALLDRDPYDAGWLYLVRGAPNASSVTLEEYMAHLDITVDRILKQESEESQGKSC
jgi:glycine cleavage system H protein